LCRRYFLQEVFVRFHFLVKITRGKGSINFTCDKGLHTLLQHFASVIRQHVIQDRTVFSMRADMPSVGPVT